MSDWKWKIEEGIGLLELDKPDTDVNVLTAESIAELQSILKELPQNKSIQALLIVSAKPRIFIAGADIREIGQIHSEKDAYEKAEGGKAVLQLLEDLPFPTICVINGACLGGGYELALACKMRVASFSSHVKIGLPEVNLGILPGFGGSIRLPKKLGLLKALPLILGGKIVSAEEASRLGMVDYLFPDRTLRQDARVLAQRLIAGKSFSEKKKPRPLMTRFLEGTDFGRNFVLNQARKDVLKRTKGFYPAPLEIIELLRGTYGKTGAEVYQKESLAFSKLGATQISKNLIHVFFMSERFKKMAWTETRPKPAAVRKCGVIGAGIMGGGIAQRVSARSILVRIKDIREAAVLGALKEAARIYQDSVKRRRMKKSDAEFQMGLISAGTDNAGLRQCNFIIEAVVEDMKIKQKVFAELSGIVPKETVLASNTSSLSVTQMAEVVSAPERVVGLHFFNPVNRMPLVEVIRAARTSDETIATAMQFARELGKTVIVVKDAPGFLVNRLLLPYLVEAGYMMEEGVSPEALDRAAEQFGMPMGPAELVDQIGMDTCLHVARILKEGLGRRMSVPPLIIKAVEKGFLGKKSGKGLYIYEGRKKRVNPELGLKTGAASLSDQDIVKRLFYMMIDEAAICLDEQIVPEAAAVDMGMILGTGFPPFRGGLLHWADSLGAEAVIQGLEQLAARVSRERFAPGRRLKELAAQGRKFYS